VNGGAVHISKIILLFFFHFLSSFTINIRKRIFNCKNTYFNKIVKNLDNLMEDPLFYFFIFYFLFFIFYFLSSFLSMLLIVSISTPSKHIAHKVRITAT
jgi:hypothetical protein